MADIMFEKSSNGIEYREYVRGHLTGALGNGAPIIKCTPKILTTITELQKHMLKFKKKKEQRKQKQQHE